MSTEEFRDRILKANPGQRLAAPEAQGCLFLLLPFPGGTAG
jgi:hypothetical protein